MSEAFLADLTDFDAAAERPLPVDRLSPSSIEGFWKCPNDWLYDKVLKVPRFSTGEQLFGSAFHRAAEHNFRAKVDSHEDLPVGEMRDVAGDSFNEVVEEVTGVEEIRWHTDKPKDVQAGVITAMVGNDSLPGYHQVLAPTVQPVAVERWIEVDTPIGVPLIGKIDVETDDGRLIDLKTGKKAKTQIDLDKSVQASAYLYGREREGNPSTGFSWQTVIRTIKPQQQELLTERTAGELAAFERLVVVTARTIRHYVDEYGLEGPWPGASPLAWWCSPTQCSNWSDCAWRGGAK